MNEMDEINFEDLIDAKIRRIDSVIDFLKYLLKAQSEEVPVKRIKSDFFNAEIRVYPIGKNLVKAVIRIEPTENIPTDLLSLLYLSELGVQDEEMRFKIAAEGSYKKMSVGNVIHLSAVINKDLLKSELKRILLKIKRAFIALNNDELRARIIEEKKKLEDMLSAPEKNKREILISLMRLNELLLYEAPVTEI